uniref:Uncharacterized protein n=1 Tax=Parascaris equorum TaxID=6256 RepID=A0A914R7V2_PAREQ
MALWDESMATLHDHNILREMRQLGVKPSEQELDAWIKLMYSLKTTAAFNEAVDILLKERQIQTVSVICIDEIVSGKSKKSSATRYLGSKCEMEIVKRRKGKVLLETFFMTSKSAEFFINSGTVSRSSIGRGIEHMTTLEKEPLSVFDFLGYFMITSGLSANADASEEWFV